MLSCEEMETIFFNVVLLWSLFNEFFILIEAYELMSNLIEQLLHLVFNIFEGNTPRFLILEILQSPLDHVKCHSDYIARLQLSPVFGPSWITIMSCLAVVDSPAVDGVREGLLQI